MEPFKMVEYLVGRVERGHALRLHGSIEFELKAGIVDVVNGYGRHIEYAATFSQDREWCNSCELGIPDHFCHFEHGKVVIGTCQSDDMDQAIIIAANKAMSFDGH